MALANKDDEVLARVLALGSNAMDVNEIDADAVVRQASLNPLPAAYQQKDQTPPFPSVCGCSR